MSAPLNPSLLSIADRLREVLRDMNAVELEIPEGRKVASTGYGHVEKGLTTVLQVLTDMERLERMGDFLRLERLREYLLDCPEDDTERCITRWREEMEAYAEDK